MAPFPILPALALKQAGPENMGIMGMYTNDMLYGKMFFNLSHEEV